MPRRAGAAIALLRPRFPSPRTFARAYAAETGVTPAKAVERLRVETARALIEAGAPSLAAVAERAGFGDIERMRRWFQACSARHPRCCGACGALPARNNRRADVYEPLR